MNRFALISDIHGNILALDAVLADIDRRGVEAIFDLGDSLQGPLEPAATADRLIERNIPSVMGNDDRAILAEPLLPKHREWIAALPRTREPAPDILLFHGTPASDLVYLLEDVQPNAVTLRDTAGIRQLLGDTGHSLYACGHTHFARTVWIGENQLVVNPGSVGLPAYRADTPHPHTMEAGTPHARYAIVTRTANTWQVDHILIPYDYAAAARTAIANHRPDWSPRLLTGRLG